MNKKVSCQFYSGSIIVPCYGFLHYMALTRSTPEILLSQISSSRNRTGPPRPPAATPGLRLPAAKTTGAARDKMITQIWFLGNSSKSFN